MVVLFILLNIVLFSRTY
ncbi:hypothetical protein H5P36_21885 [Bacillus sp. APMAM]|nr:hypothetical protein [Bacillus sp. APMAM]NEZ02073.1 hypothetical protein [Heyndrickxia shackletonii]RTZ53743.1 hypothetical protein EKO25_21755 [Bacillus sp. SAJ1]